MRIDFQTKTILIVDDITTNRILLSALLQDEGYNTIFEASSAQEAYTILQTKRIDLILLDVMMPEIDGVEACKHIREDEKNSHIPIIMVTSDDRDETLTQSFKVGATDYVTKPINATNLKVRMASIFLNAQKDTIIQQQNRLLVANETVQMLAHQWRQPLSAINADILKITSQNELDLLKKNELNIDLKTISSNIQKLSKKLDEFQKITSNESLATLVNIDDVLQTSISLVADKFKRSHIDISTDYRSQEKLLIFQNELVDILVNVYINSFEAFALEDKNKVKKLHISSSSTQEYVTIVIKDNAGGIEEDFLKNIFEPYVSSKCQKNGVGLGLYNAFVTLKTLMNAKIAIESIEDSSTLSIVIPVRRS